MDASHRIFSKIEKFSGKKYPKFVKNILIFCGFDSEIALSTLNEQSIKEIEIIVNQNKNLITDSRYKIRRGLGNLPSEFCTSKEN